jgi:hypothetical protein
LREEAVPPGAEKGKTDNKQERQVKDVGRIENNEAEKKDREGLPGLCGE